MVLSLPSKIDHMQGQGFTPGPHHVATPAIRVRIARRKPCGYPLYCQLYSCGTEISLAAARVHPLSAAAISRAVGRSRCLNARSVAL